LGFLIALFIAFFFYDEDIFLKNFKILFLLILTCSFSLCDDILLLSAKVKAFFQILISINLIIFDFDVEFFNIYFLDLFLNLLFFLIVFNITNFFDNFDGGLLSIYLPLFLFFLVFGLIINIDIYIILITSVYSISLIVFYYFNSYPSKIFMGDVGSGFLGLVIGLLVLHLWQTDIVPLSVSLILLATFWFDASYTLFVRLVTGQRVTQAHRLHLYQWLAMRRGHLYTNAVFLVFSVFWLMPLAWWAFPASRTALMSSAAIVLAILPMLFACWRFKVGLPAGEDVA